MQLPPDRPISLATAFALVGVITQIVPAGERGQFKYDWQQKLFHRWQFLRETSLWNPSEELKLLCAATLVLPDAIQHFGAQEAVRRRVSRFIQSPFTCLGGLAFVLLLIVGFSGGLPATRDLLFKRVDFAGEKLIYVWSHNLRRGGDRPIPSEVIKAWKTHSQLVSGVAAFRAVPRDVQPHGGPAQRRLVITTEPSFFQVMGAKLSTGRVNQTSQPYVLLSHDAWIQEFRASPHVEGSNVSVSGHSYPIFGILPAGFAPLSRQAAVYLVEPQYSDQDAYAALRTKAGITQSALDKELTQIAQNVTYYFLNGQIRFGSAQAAIWTPVASFACGILASLIMLLIVFRVKWRMLWPQARHGRAFARRTTFFAAKTFLGLAVIFTVCLEWSRSSSAILFGNFDPASGPFLLWLFILGVMGVSFCAVADQKARCRECLQLLAFPVRMGTPGNLLMDWSGIELCCTSGHGVLHVPHLAPTWADESDHWIALDDSWQSIFGQDKRG